MAESFEANKDDFAKYRAYCILAVTDIVTQRDLGNLGYFADKPTNTSVGPTYTEVREWILQRKEFPMEGVGTRCRECCRNVEPSVGHPLLRKEVGEGGKVHLYPYTYRNPVVSDLKTKEIFGKEVLTKDLTFKPGED